MKLGVKFIPAQDWLPMAKSAHLACFGDEVDADFHFIDYALLAVDEDTDTPLAYLTARRLNHELVNWSFGGAFAPIYGGLHVVNCYRAFIGFQKESVPCKRIITLIKNDNIRSLKLAMAHGFRIIGTKSYKDETMVELILDFEKEA